MTYWPMRTKERKKEGETEVGKDEVDSVQDCDAFQCEGLREGFPVHTGLHVQKGTQSCTIIRPHTILNPPPGRTCVFYIVMCHITINKLISF